jgi:glycosyltransferase involved in cell wall biosynthesis
MKKPDIWVVIPAYNENKSIAKVLEQFIPYPYGVVVVDDGSNDNTLEQVTHYDVVALKHMINLGQGAALQTGIKYALQFPETRAVVTFDSDGQHCVEEIDPLLKPLSAGYDIVLGSRFLKGGMTINLPPERRLVLKLAVLFTRITTGLTLTDTHNGMRAFDVNAARKLQIHQNRMAHASEILSFIASNHLRYCEVPVTIKYSDYSLSKGQSIFNSLNIFWEIISGYLK